MARQRKWPAYAAGEAYWWLRPAWLLLPSISHRQPLAISEHSHWQLWNHWKRPHQHIEHDISSFKVEMSYGFVEMCRIMTGLLRQYYMAIRHHFAFNGTANESHISMTWSAAALYVNRLVEVFLTRHNEASHFRRFSRHYMILISQWCHIYIAYVFESES